MFVEKLTEKQFADYLKKVPGYSNVKESDINFTGVRINGYVLFSLATKKSNKIFTATDKYIIDKNNTNWGKYLYSIFGEEYKNWYIKQLKNEFEEIFS